MTAAADRHLLFGLLALQNGLIDQGALVVAFQAWTRDKTRSLDDQLVARGDLDAEAVTEADAAMAPIRKAIEMGYRDVGAYRTEDALDPLRSRDDFRLLMMDLEFPSDPFAPDTDAHR